MGEKELVLETIIIGSSQSVANSNNKVIRDRREWGRFLDMLYNESPRMVLFAADFNNEMVIAAFRQNREAYNIQIDRAVETEDAINVYIKKKDYQGITIALTKPEPCSYHIVKTKKSDKKVSFVYE